MKGNVSNAGRSPFICPGVTGSATRKPALSAGMRSAIIDRTFPVHPILTYSFCSQQVGGGRNYPSFLLLMITSIEIPTTPGIPIFMHNASSKNGGQVRFVWITPEKAFVTGEMAEKRFALPIVRAPGYPIPSEISGLVRIVGIFCHFLTFSCPCVAP
jgi:hypothetical protein